MKEKIFIPLLIVLFLLNACTGSRGLDPNPPDTDNPTKSLPEETSGEVPAEAEIDLEEIRPNEIGPVMILMYHQIGEPEGEWTRTPANFRRDLQRLYDGGYRLIGLNDFLDNNITVEAGFTPVVLTFDDGSRGQFNYLEDETIDPNSAVGILESFYREHPDFGLGGTFFIYYGNPFGQSQYVAKKLAHLAEAGFEIGNHAFSHANLSKISPEVVQEELAKHLLKTQEYLPYYSVRSLALPYGASPKDPSLLREGVFAGQPYKLDCALLVGAEPAPAPNHKNYDPYRLPRIRADEEQLDKWFTYFENNPEKRYLSDGNPDIITVPREKAGDILDDGSGTKKLRFYP